MRRITIILLTLCLSIPLAAQTNDSILFAAYQREDMTVWKNHIDSLSLLHSFTPSLLQYEYGYCGYIVAEAKKDGKEALLPEAKQHVQQFKAHVKALKSQLPTGHYEMYMSAVYVFELRLHESVHPFKSMSLAQDAVQRAPKDPLTLSYYGTCLFYAPSPFGNKREALKWFEKAQPYFETPQYRFSWMRAANEMYIKQCKEKLK